METVGLARRAVQLEGQLIQRAAVPNAINPIPRLVRISVSNRTTACREAGLARGHGFAAPLIANALCRLGIACVMGDSARKVSGIANGTSSTPPM